MEIKNIKKFKTKIKIIFDNDSFLEINPNTYINYRFYEGKIISKKEIKEIKEFDKEEKLYDFALKKLYLKNYTSGELKNILLKKNSSLNECNKVISRLIKNNYLNDQIYVDDVLQYANYRHIGYNKIIHKLYDKKVSEEIIKTVPYDYKRETKEAKEYIKINKHKYSNKNDKEKKKSLYSALLRNGFSHDISIELVNKISNSNEKHEKNVLKLEYLKAKSRYSKKYSGDTLNKKITSFLIAKGFSISDIENLEGVKNEMD